MVLGNDLGYEFGMANLRYMTQVGSRFGGYCVFPLEGHPIVYNGLPHMARPFSIYEHTQSWVSDIRVNTGMRGVVDSIRDLGFERGRIGLVAFGMTIWGRNILHDALLSGLPDSGCCRSEARQRPGQLLPRRCGGAS